ncbi:zinc finger domain-containing protein [Streptomyces lunaelactis]|uniref:zinc finger domain-containing protein n=1 Tax=Streptomyces lunaelactis TaxID=1535768 RepID=UPI0026BDAB83
MEEEIEEGERAAQVAVTTRPLSGPLADSERQEAFRETQASQPYDNGQREAWWKQRTAVLDEIKAQGIKEALDWDCRDCGADVGQPCHTAGGRRRDPHFLRATDAELPYHRAYGLG